jgi:hypothetical protein
VVNTAACEPCSEVEPTKIANARPREMDLDATRIAPANENTMPTLTNVRGIPDPIPNMSGGSRGKHLLSLTKGGFYASRD